MDAFEKSLKEAMRRESPPEGFAERVLSRAGHDRINVRGWRRMRFLMWASAALAVVVLLIGLTEYRRAQRIRGERARQELLLALHIAGSKLRVVQNRLVEINRKGDD
jgi:hypothetical protein